MRLATVVLGLFLLLGLVNAEQLLNMGQFLYNNVTVQNGENIVVGVNTSSSVELMVISSSEFGKYIYGEKVTAIYNYTVRSGIFTINANPGNYTVIVQGSASVDVGSMAVPANKGATINLVGRYTYNFYLSNYSYVAVSILSSDDFQGTPVIVNVSGSQVVISKDKNFYILYFDLNRGEHNITMFTPGSMDLFLYVNSTPQLVNPLSGLSPGGSYSAGVAGYGVYNISGTLYPYQIKTDEVVGDANISVLSAHDTDHAVNASASGASLQLNVGLNTYVNKKPVEYWLQDVVDFNTSSHQYYLVDNIWNNTGAESDVARYSLEGKGNITYCTTCNNSQAFYAYTYPRFYLNYSFPLHVKLIIKENYSAGGSSIVWFGYQILQNGSTGTSPLVFFDHVSIPGSSNTTILTTPYYQTPGGKNTYGSYYDTELVFGGESNGANAHFNSIGAGLWIYYDKNGTLEPFPSVYTFGLSTAESASNVQVLTAKNGAYATTGQPNYTRDILASNALAGIAAYIANTSRYTTQPTTAPTTTAPVTIQINGNVPASEINAIEIVAAIAIVFIVVVGFLLHRRHGSYQRM